MRKQTLRISALMLMLVLTLPSLSRAESTFWPMLDSGAIDHDLKNRWNDPINWCGETIVSEIVKLMATTQRVVITGQTIALATKGTSIRARESLVSASHSYGFWSLSTGRSLVIELRCTAPTVCALTANLIVHDGARICLERWHTVAYRGAAPLRQSSPAKP